MSPLASEIVGSDRSVLLLHLPGQVTDECVAQIQEEVQTRLPRVDGAGLVLDFDSVELINSIGITCLLQVEEECRRRRARMVLSRVPPAIGRFLAQVKLDRRFKIVPDLDQALRHVDAIG
ncbi:MAG: anti-sigma factor antagonist [Phycisphaeraceae bacterium]|nr:anti-sigma factor antagonist [Phycisphaeraceae bacterium]